jgi:hypothetical protein
MKKVSYGPLARPSRSLAPRAGRASVVRPVARLAMAAALALPLASCTSQQRAGESSSYLIVTSLTAASGATPGVFGNVLPSDVITNVKANIAGKEVLVPTVFEDVGQVTMSLGLKDPGTPDSPTKPSANNSVTVTRYHVEFVRSDGRSTPGVDVPYPFDGAATFTVGASSTSATVTLVRIQAKAEAPLLALVNNGGAGVISTIARITFYGTDQTGREVSVSAQISVNFSDWGDPQ